MVRYLSTDYKLQMKTLPQFIYEKTWWENDCLVIGIDEVGKGALAGPVYSAAVCFDPLLIHDAYSIIESWGITDSKQLTPHKRQEIDALLRNNVCYFGIGSADVECINSAGITSATKRSMQRAIEMVMSSIDKKREIKLVVDGYGFSLENSQGSPWELEGIIKGDSKILSISAASIIAKVARDRYMSELATMYPVYGFEKHKGYGTITHRKAIREYGECEYHRTLFIRKIKA